MSPRLPEPPGHGCGADAAAFVLGALPAEERSEFVRHLETCVVCREEVAELQMVVDALPAVAPQLNAPAELRRQVIASVRSEPDAEPVAPQPVLARLAASVRSRTRPDTRRWRLAVAALAAAVVALAVALGLSGGGGGPRTRVIHAQVLARGASASLRLSGGRAVLEVRGMPQTSAGRVYEVWLARGGAPEPTDALFSVTRRGGEASVAVPGSTAGLREVLVTSEPLGGSRAPTTQPLILARLG